MSLITLLILIFLKKETVKIKITKIEIKSAIGEENKIPFIPLPTLFFSSNIDNIKENGIKQTISLIKEEIIA